MTIKPDLKGAKAFVTGASGFVGQHLLSALTAAGATVSTLQHENGVDAARGTVYFGDIRDAAGVTRAVHGSAPDMIFHLAAFKQRSAQIGDFARAVETNVLGSLNLLTAAATLPQLKSIVVIGTAEEYGHNVAPFTENMRELPVNAYSQSKQSLTHLCEVLHRLHKLPVVVLRPSVAYGPGQSSDMFLPALILSLLHNTPFPMTHGEQTRDFVYVSDLVDAMLMAATCAGVAGEVLNIGGGQPVTIATLARKVSAMTGRPDLLQPGKLPYRPGEIMDYRVDTAKANRLLGWTPRIDLDAGLAATIDYFKQRT